MVIAHNRRQNGNQWRKETPVLRRAIFQGEEKKRGRTLKRLSSVFAKPARGPRTGLTKRSRENSRKRGGREGRIFGTEIRLDKSKVFY